MNNDCISHCVGGRWVVAEIPRVVRLDKIHADIIHGLFSGFPRCCIEWFSYVWAPVFGVVHDSPEAVRMLRGHSKVGYVQCPTCRIEGVKFCN